MHNKHSKILFLIYIVALTALSLINIGELPKLGSSYDDKIFHIIAHAILVLLCYNALHFKSSKKKIVVSVLIAVSYGIIIEVLQLILNMLRTFDLFDIVANCLGVILAIFIINIKTQLK